LHLFLLLLQGLGFVGFSTELISSLCFARSRSLFSLGIFCAGVNYLFPFWGPSGPGFPQLDHFFLGFDQVLSPPSAQGNLCAVFFFKFTGAENLFLFGL